MKKKHVCLVLTLIGLLWATAFSLQQTGSASTDQKRVPASGSSPSPRPSPSPTELTKKLAQIQDTIKRYNEGDEAEAFEMTTNFNFSSCDDGCKGCMLSWSFVSYEAEKPGEKRTYETFPVTVELAAIDPKLVVVEETLVRFGTNNGKTISVTIPKQSYRAGRTVNGVPTATEAAKEEKTSSWRIEVRDERGAKEVRDYLKQILEKLCKKP